MKDQKFIHKSLLERSKNFPPLYILIKKNGTLKLKKPSIDFFSFVCKIIISQQISNKSAETIWKKIEVLSKEKKLIELIKKNEKYKFGFSKRKQNFMIKFYEMISSKIISEQRLKNLNNELFNQELLQVSGIGQWSVDMIKIFYFNNLNVWPEGDLVIKRKVRKINHELGLNINYKKEFYPYLSILSLHFWKSSD